MRQSFTLPEPDLAEQSLSRELQSQIATEIINHGSIDFAKYMELALYAPRLGYYRNGSQKFGKSGDFITAPELSPLFSRCIARQCQEVLQNLRGGDILEFGPGSGAMTVAILQFLRDQNALPDRYLIIELSAELQQRQYQKIQNEIPDYLPRVTWLDRLPSSLFRGVMLANEILDAMPVHRFGFYQGMQEYSVILNQQNLGWRLGPCSNPDLQKRVEELDIDFIEGYTSEINLLLPFWIKSLAEILTQGLILITDYGMTRHEYYHPDRHCGTLLCHYRHLAHANPFWWPGSQDITAQVDFTAVAEAAVANHMDVAGYTHQAAFLLNCGITEDAFIQTSDLKQRRIFNQHIKQLTLPGEMGESFKAIALTKEYDNHLLGFQFMNQIERL